MNSGALFIMLWLGALRWTTSSHSRALIAGRLRPAHVTQAPWLVQAGFLHQCSSLPHSFLQLRSTLNHGGQKGRVAARWTSTTLGSAKIASEKSSTRRRQRRFNASLASEELVATLSIAEDLDNDMQADGNSELLPESAVLLDPATIFNGTIPYPTSLSPSSINEFKKCPQSFLFQYLYGLKQPTTLALAKGSTCHSALEKVFDLDPEQRTLNVLQDLFRSSWAERRSQPEYKELFDDLTSHQRDLLAEATWGKEGLKLLENYYQAEDPTRITRPNPVQRECWVQARLSLDPTKGVTGYVHPASQRSVQNVHFISQKKVNGHQANGGERQQSASSGVDPTADTFLVRGIVDRLDMVLVSKSEVALRMVDYKTGKAPSLKYNRATNERIQAEAFYQLLIYALLLRERGADLESSLPIRYLRLFYLTSEEGPAAAWDMDLGETAIERDSLLQAVHSDLANTWLQILDLVSQQDPKVWKGCDRSFCYCHKCRSRFATGTVWEPTERVSSVGR